MRIFSSLCDSPLSHFGWKKWEREIFCYFRCESLRYRRIIDIKICSKSTIIKSWQSPVRIRAKCVAAQREPREFFFINSSLGLSFLGGNFCVSSSMTGWAKWSWEYKVQILTDKSTTRSSSSLRDQLTFRVIDRKLRALMTERKKSFHSLFSHDGIIVGISMNNHFQSRRKRTPPTSVCGDWNTRKVSKGKVWSTPGAVDTWLFAASLHF